MRGFRFFAAAALFVVFASVPATPQASRRPTGQPPAPTAKQLFFEGFELLQASKYAEAAAKFERGLALEPNNAAGHFYLGQAHLGLGEKEKAAQDWKKSLEIAPNGDQAADARKRLAELENAPGRVIKDCARCPEIVVLPAGEFVMGSPPSEAGRYDDEGPAHIVTIARPFGVGKYEVTFDEWDACVTGGGCKAVEDSGFGRGRRPVINVNYEQAVGYTEWLSETTGRKYRLPSEGEWEYAARAGSDRARYWGTLSERACEFANVADASLKRNKPSWWKDEWPFHECDDGFGQSTAPVGTFKPNAFGLYDMLGNVWEWVEDVYNKSYEGAPNDGRSRATGDTSLGVVRGAGWISEPQVARSAFRYTNQPSGRGNGVGFRVARTLP